MEWSPVRAPDARIGALSLLAGALLGCGCGVAAAPAGAVEAPTSSVPAPEAAGPSPAGEDSDPAAPEGGGNAARDEDCLGSPAPPPGPCDGELLTLVRGAVRPVSNVLKMTVYGVTPGVAPAVGPPRQGVQWERTVLTPGRLCEDDDEIVLCVPGGSPVDVVVLLDATWDDDACTEGDFHGRADAPATVVVVDAVLAPEDCARGPS